VQLGTKNNDPNLNVYKVNFERASKALSNGGKTPEK
jgi:hypothetical protein